MGARKKAGARSARIIARVTEEQLRALERIAHEDGANVSELMRRLVADEIRRRKGTKR